MFANRPADRSARLCLTLVLGAGLLPAALGCGGSDRRVYHVSGTVTFDGQPVPGGFVVFEPDVSAGNDGTQGFAHIEEGRFDTARGGRGVTGGAYLVQLRGNAPSRDSGVMLTWQYEQSIDLPAADSRQEIAVPPSAATEMQPLADPP